MKKLIIMIVGLLVSAMLLQGCNDVFNSPDTTKAPVTNTPPVKSEEITNDKIVKLNLYFPTIDNSRILIEERDVKVKDDEVMTATIDTLIKGPETSELRNAIPAGTKLLSIKRDGNIALVDFSKEYSEVNDQDELVKRISVVNTLTGINGIEKVKITVEGNAIVGSNGEPLGEMTEILLDSLGHPKNNEEKTLTLYFSDMQAEYLVPETRNIKMNKGDKTEAVIFEELKKGPQSDGLGEVIPEGTRLLSSEIKDGICTLNFTKDFVDNNMGGSAGEMMTLYAIINSMTELTEVKKVQFKIEGKIREVYIHSVLDVPYERNEKIIKSQAN